jgi:hypothetical protein
MLGNMPSNSSNNLSEHVFMGWREGQKGQKKKSNRVEKEKEEGEGTGGKGKRKLVE